MSLVLTPEIPSLPQNTKIGPVVELGVGLRKKNRPEKATK